MSKLENPIGWCDDTTNAVTGCDKISTGCAHCYAAAGTRARVLLAQGIETWGPKGTRHPVAEMPAKLRRLNKLCICDQCHQTAPYEIHIGKRCHSCALTPDPSHLAPTYRRLRLFADSNSDWLDPKWPIETLANFLNQIRLSPNVDVLLLTKRPKLWPTRVLELMAFIREEVKKQGYDWDALFHFLRDWIEVGPPPGVWLGVSVENQKYADERIPALLKIPAAIHFLSCEPLLENIDLFGTRPDIDQGIDWVIVGGESGKKRRDCGVNAIESIAEQCTGVPLVPVYVKQDCAFKSGQQGRIDNYIWNLKQFPAAKNQNLLHEFH